MPSSLADPSLVTLTLLGVAAGVASLVWWQRRTRPALYGALATAGLLALVIACDYLFESPREQAVRLTRELADHANARRFDAARDYLANDFRFRSLDREKFIAFARDGVTRFEATAHFTSFDRGEAVELDSGGVRIGFSGQVHSPRIPQGRGACYVEATYAPDAARRLKLQKIEVFEYIARQTPQAIPGL